MRVQKRGEVLVIVVKRLIYRIAGQHRRQGQIAASQSFGKTDEIRADGRLFAGEQGAGAAKTNRYLVGDQMHAVSVASLAQHCQINRVIHAHATGALYQRFDDHRTHRIGVFCQSSLHVGETAD